MQKMTAKTPRSRKNKGANFQKEVARKLAEKYNMDFGQDMDFFGRQMGGSGTDIVLSRDAKEYCPFDIEVKRTEKIEIPKWWQQAVENTQDGRIPLIIFKRNKENAKVVLDFEDFLSLL